mmetsp:Transcript_9409/g.17403  ORF Transcript_9409/g.17403 Transcript_9409/m.17403 type:complete len:462 (-) Transcript_9409:19-1404(-)
MGRLDIPLNAVLEDVEEQPHCAWCGSVSRSVCGYCKVRAYCSPECQQLDWKSGHQTACSRVAPCPKRAEEETFQFYEVPYVVRWAINLERWRVSADSREYAFLLSRIPDADARRRIASQPSWSTVKLALAKELAVRRMAEVLTQAIWTKVQWRHDPDTDRDFLVQREEYVWTGQKYQNSNRRFPNFNFSMFETDSYLFLVTHPLAITGVYASGPITASMPDPRDAFAQDLESARSQTCTEATRPAAPDTRGEACSDVKEQPEDPGVDPEEDPRMLGDAELLEVCDPCDEEQRRKRLQLALVGKFAYYRTLGQTARRQWSQIVVGQNEVSEAVAGSPEPGEDDRPGRPRRHPLHVAKKPLSRWRCDVHNWHGHCVIVCRGPPEEAMDPDGEFQRTQAARFPEIDTYDKALEHLEPTFIQVPIRQLLPDKWHSDYVRACGGGERGDQTRINDVGPYKPHIPKV